MNHVNTIAQLTSDYEDRIQRNPLLNIDTFIIPSPYVKDAIVERDYSHSYVWIEEDEILGYLLVFSDREKRNFHIYKLVTSPFARGRGIGTTFIMYLAYNIPANASIYLYIWEKQVDTVEFFQNKGFHVGESMVYRNLIYHHMYVSREEIMAHAYDDSKKKILAADEIGKTRHDARKTLRLLSSMVDTLSISNCGRIIEDINRETTTLINILNSFRDTVNRIHEVNLQELILDRIIPYVENSSIPCRMDIRLHAASPIILGYYVNIGRALVNLAANSLDAIKASGRTGLIEIGIRDDSNRIYLDLADNGEGIAPELLKVDDQGLPAFVGNTTKAHRTGEGLGTVQIFSTFGVENIAVTSRVGEGTRWKIAFDKSRKGVDIWFVRLDRRFQEFRTLWETCSINSETSRNGIITYIWQLRKMEIFLFDVILQFSKYHNIRTIYRSVLSFLRGHRPMSELEAEVALYKCDHEVMKTWLLNTAGLIYEKTEILKRHSRPSEYQGALFKSYGQALDNVIIFTMNPENGEFLATDRKLAEHLDFVYHLGLPRDKCLRGEFIGDMNNDTQPISLGVWSIDSQADLVTKLKLLRRGAQTLIDIGIHTTKKLTFYKTTYVRHEYEVDPDRSSTLGEFALTSDDNLLIYVRHSEEEFQEMLFQTE